MDMDLLDLYRQSSDWAGEKVAAASNDLDAATPCDEWDVRTLMNHMLETQQYFVALGAQARTLRLPRRRLPTLMER